LYILIANLKTKTSAPNDSKHSPTSIKMGGACSTYVGRGVVHTGFWWGNVRGRDHLDEPGIDGRIILRWIFRKWDVGALTGLILLRTGTGGGHL
jgi:hypothetical protein